MRHLILLLALGASCGIIGFSTPSNANDIYLGKHTAADLEAICTKAGGKFTQDSRSYGCGTDCHGLPGTACSVYCPTGEKCVAQVIGGRRPRHVLDALMGPKHHGG
ncbi:MAG TPA: hypothetical protein VIJ78_00210 [Pseudolabrys sp.]